MMPIKGVEMEYLCRMLRKKNPSKFSSIFRGKFGRNPSRRYKYTLAMICQQRQSLVAIKIKHINKSVLSNEHGKAPRDIRQSVSSFSIPPSSILNKLLPYQQVSGKLIRADTLECLELAFLLRLVARNMLSRAFGG